MPMRGSRSIPCRCPCRPRANPPDASCRLLLHGPASHQCHIQLTRHVPATMPAGGPSMQQARPMDRECRHASRFSALAGLGPVKVHAAAASCRRRDMWPPPLCVHRQACLASRHLPAPRKDRQRVRGPPAAAPGLRPAHLHLWSAARPAEDAVQWSAQVSSGCLGRQQPPTTPPPAPLQPAQSHTASGQAGNLYTLVPPQSL